MPRKSSVGQVSDFGFCNLTVNFKVLIKERLLTTDFFFFFSNIYLTTLKWNWFLFCLCFLLVSLASNWNCTEYAVE